MLEILVIDQESYYSSGLEFPDFSLNFGINDPQDFLIKALSTVVVFFIFFMLTLIIFYIFKLAVAGSDEENIEHAKQNIKTSSVFFILAVVSWVIISFFRGGAMISL